MQRVVIVIADISGYTRFMIANQTELAHSHEIISTLLEKIIAEIEIPLTLGKLEGDAVFLYFDAAPHSSTRSPEAWSWRVSTSSWRTVF